MITKIIEAVQNINRAQNWGKFMVMRPREEWLRYSKVAPVEYKDLVSAWPLLRQCGWADDHIWVCDLQTGEGACFVPSGVPRADLNNHRIWVCPLFEPFLEWLYRQDLKDITQLPDLVELPNAEFAMFGRRREGRNDTMAAGFSYRFDYSDDTKKS